MLRRPDGRIWVALRKELSWPPPRRSSAPASASQTPAGTYLITLDFAEVDGRLECVRFAIGTDVEDPDAPDPAPLTASALRAVPLRELIDDTLFQQTKSLRRWARAAGPSGGEASDLRDRVAAAEASLGRAPGRPPEYTEDHFKLVADAYTRAWKINLPPRAAVATRWQVSRSTAAKWVARARQMGFLPPTERGRPRGGQPTAEATKANPTPRARPSRRLEEIDRIEAREEMQLEVLERHEKWLAELVGLARSTAPRRADLHKEGRDVQGKGARRARPRKKR